MLVLFFAIVLLLFVIIVVSTTSITQNNIRLVTVTFCVIRFQVLEVATPAAAQMRTEAGEQKV